MLALGQEITPTQGAQQDAQAAHARLVEAFNVVPEGIALMDADDRLVLWNNQYAETYRASGNVIRAGMRFEDLLLVTEDGYELLTSFPYGLTP